MTSTSQITFKPSNIYVMVNNRIIESEKPIPIFIYTGNKYIYQVNKIKNQEINSLDVMAAVNRAYGIDILDLGRKHPKPQARKMFYFVLKEIAKTHLSLEKIGDLINGQDHTTVIYQTKKAYESLDIADRNFIFYLQEVCKFLKLELVVKKR